MFTGIVTDVGKLLVAEDRNDGRRLRIGTRYAPDTIDLGASITVDGICLTVTEKGTEGGQNWFDAFAALETLAVTEVGKWRVGRRINLERSLKIGDELGGHIVSGHVDGVGQVLSIDPEGGSHRVRIRAPRPLHRYIAPKGSVAVEGVSLTVNEVEDDVFGVNIIPHTWDVTTLGGLKPGDPVNLEIDMLARYLARWQETA